MDELKAPLTAANAQAWYDLVYAPWVKAQGLCDFEVREGFFAARLPQAAAMQFSSGAVCGQAMMSAIDTVASMAACTGDRTTKGTVYQHTHFVRPAKGDDLRVAASVLRFGKASAFIETQVTFVGSGELVAHATLEFAF
jgi:acyl-coenzyme A thioesterase PaaI-like protein